MAFCSGSLIILGRGLPDPPVAHHRACDDVSESQPAQGVEHLAILVESGCETHGIVEVQIAEADLQPLVSDEQPLPPDEAAQERTPQEGAGQLMDRFGIEPEKQRPQPPLVEIHISTR